MRHGMKMAVALGFVGAVAIAATAFAQTGTPSPNGERRKARANAQKTECGRPGQRPQRAAAKRVVHSETKVAVRDGGFALVIVDTGTISAVQGSSVTIKRLDGESVTVTASDETRICKDGAKATVEALKVGDRAGINQVTRDGQTRVRAIRVHTPNASTDAPARQRPAIAEDDLLEEMSA